MSAPSPALDVAPMWFLLASSAGFIFLSTWSAYKVGSHAHRVCSWVLVTVSGLLAATLPFLGRETNFHIAVNHALLWLTVLLLMTSLAAILLASVLKHKRDQRNTA